MESPRDPGPSDSETKQTDEGAAGGFPSSVTRSAVSECLNGWIYYLQMLNGLCSAGLKLSQCLTNLAQSSGQSVGVAGQCQASWDELTKATVVASHTVKTHVTAAIQDMSTVDTHSEADLQIQVENNQQIVWENLLTFINLQYQFSITSCELLGAMATCPCCQTASWGAHDPDCTMATLQQCFARLYSQDSRSQTSSPHSVPQSSSYQLEKPNLESPKSLSNPHHERTTFPYVSEGPRVHSPVMTFTSDTRVPSPFQSQHEQPRGPSPIQGFMDTIRGPGHIESVRGPFPNPGQLHTMKAPFPGRRGSRSPLNFPLFPLSGQRRWSEAAAAEMAGESNDGTMRRWSMPWDSTKTEQQCSWPGRLLPMSKLAVPTATSSQDRSRSNTPEGVCLPSIISSDGLAEAIQLLSSRPTRNTIQSHAPQQPSPSATSTGPSWMEGAHTDERMTRKMYHLHIHRGNMGTQDPQQSPNLLAEPYEVYHTTFPHSSRKSSSSTDSSSCLSIHSRSTTSSDKGSESGGDAMRTHSHLYSIWSGSEYLPFVRVPESKEPQDGSDTDETSTTDGGSQASIPKPT